MTRKVLLGAGAAAVIALLAGLVVAVRGSPSRGGPRPSAAPATPVTESPAAESPPPVARPSAPVAVAPSEPRKREPGVPVVHDHRKEPPSGTPSVVVPESVAAVQRLIQPAVNACAETPGPKPRVPVNVQVDVRVAAGRISLQKPQVNAPEPLADAFVACVQTAVVSLGADAPPGQEEGEQSVLFSLRVP